ncbi:conserved hypothetical protein [Vibrio chagasii]|nr:conserved hypothetical protein [Vibrio chagasii]
MSKVKTKLLNAFEALKKEGKKVSPFAVEKRAGVANGSCKNHPTILDMVLAEKSRYHQNPEITKKDVSKNKKYIDKEKYDGLEKSNKRLRAENDQFIGEMKVMATSVAQLTWELHRYKTSTRKQSMNVKNIKA